MPPEALQRIATARQRDPYRVRELNRRAKRRERARQQAVDPAGYRQRRAAEMRAWRAQRNCTDGQLDVLCTVQ